MAYSGKPFFKIPRPLLLAGGVESQTISGDTSLTDKDSLFQIIDGGGSDRDVTLPAEKDGRVYMIKNSGATNSLVIKNDAAATIETLTSGQTTMVVCDGTNWLTMFKV